jgi:hypothetical protein
VTVARATAEAGLGSSAYAAAFEDGAASEPKQLLGDLLGLGAGSLVDRPLVAQ